MANNHQQAAAAPQLSTSGAKPAQNQAEGDAQAKPGAPAKVRECFLAPGYFTLISDKSPPALSDRSEVARS